MYIHIKLHKYVCVCIFIYILTPYEHCSAKSLAHGLKRAGNNTWYVGWQNLCVYTIYIHAHTHKHTHIHIHTCVCVYVYILRVFV